MNFTARQRILLETNAARDKAEALLAGLLNAQQIVDRHEPQPCSARLVSRESMDRAISSTKQLIHMLNAQLDSAQHDLQDEDLSILDELDETNPNAAD